MIKIKLFSVGKTREEWLRIALEEYLKRLTGVVEIEFVWAKTDDQLELLVVKETALICLDPKGLMLTSESFSTFLIKQIENHNSRLAFVIGGADGLSETIKKGRTLISLSLLTFTHQLTRLILIEQIYRAFEINRGSNYHK